jgi:hypothetical protein
MNCLKCQKREGICNIKVGMGKFNEFTTFSEKSIWDDALENETKLYDTVIIDIPVCKYCYRLYHLKSELQKWIFIALIIIGIVYAIWGYIIGGFGIGFAYGFGAVVILGLLGAIPYWLFVEKLVGFVSNPNKYLKNCTKCLELRQSGYTELFYVNKKGKIESKQKIHYEI